MRSVGCFAAAADFWQRSAAGVATTAVADAAEESDVT